MPVGFNALDEFNHVRNVLGRFAYNVGLGNVQPLKILKKRVGVKLGNFKHRLPALARRLYHLVLALIVIARKMSNVRDIHNVLFFITQIGERAVEHIQKHIGAQIADMGVIIHRGTAAIKPRFARSYGNKILHCPAHCIKKT